MQNKPLTKEEVKELGKGIYLHKFPNRKKRRESLQSPSSPTGNRLLVYERGSFGANKPFKLKERTQRIPIWGDIEGTPLPRIQGLYMGYGVKPIKYRSILHYD